MRFKPLKQWRCDGCHQLIEDVDREMHNVVGLEIEDFETSFLAEHESPKEAWAILKPQLTRLAETNPGEFKNQLLETIRPLLGTHATT
jgi:hypothetical protein